MSLTGPDPDDILAGLDFKVEEPVDVVDVTKLTQIELLDYEQQTKKRLYELKEMFVDADQRSEEGKNLHSIYLACQVEKHRRGW